MKHVILGGIASALLLSIGAASAKPADKLETRVRDRMRAATSFMMDEVSCNGGFVWNYLPDLSRRWGEMEAKPTMVWIQPPGTPSVGHLLLDAYHATGDEYYYEQAKRVANALIWGQLECGGWNYCFDFAGENSLKEWYRTVGHAGWRLEEFRHYYGNATFDDGGTMEAATFLLRMYVEKYDPTYRPALEKVIRFALDSQYPVGGWPQRWPLSYDHPFQGQADYSSFITLNDDVMPDIIDFLTQCYQSLGMQNLKEPILRAMYLMITLQQGAPYAGWADQYTVDDLKPAHARSYEPRGVNTGTTVRMIILMLDYYKLTADTRFLAGIPAAIDFLEASRLPDDVVEASGRAGKRRMDQSGNFVTARFIDPDTGKPLFVHRKGSNTANGHYYVDQRPEQTIAHYSSFAGVNPSRLRQLYEEVKALPREELQKDSPFLNNELIPLRKYYTRMRGGQAALSDAEAAQLLDAQDARGAWLSPLTTTSNPYIPCSDTTPSDETQYGQTLVGDRYDTSPYACTEETPCISVRTYIQNMARLIGWLNAK